MQENGSDFTLSKPTEGVKLSGAAAGGATVNGSTLWRHPLGGGRRCNVRIGSSRSAVTMNISWHRLLLVRISQATGRRRYWTDILKIIFLIPCIRLYMQRIWGFLFQFTKVLLSLLFQLFPDEIIYINSICSKHKDLVFR